MIKEINFSKHAVERINQLIGKKPSGTFFRIAVKGGGCSGFKYDFSFDKEIDETYIWPKVSRLIEKYEPFVRVDMDKCKHMLVEKTRELIDE